MMERVYQITITVKEYYEGELDTIRIWDGRDPAGLEDDLPFLKPYRRVVYKDWHDAAKAMDEIVKGIEDELRSAEEEEPIELISTIPTSDGIDINVQLGCEDITLSVCVESLKVL